MIRAVRALHRNEWYDPVASGSLYESTYQQVLMDGADHLFPGYRACPFDPVVETEDGATAKPDFALIDQQYRRWWVVEVELASHSLKSHVLPQMRTLAGARYGWREAEILGNAVAGLEPDRVKEMVRSTPPGILVVVDDLPPTWEEPLSRIGVHLMEVKVFRSFRNEKLFVVNGTLPSVPDEIVSVCTPDRVLPRFLMVESPANLGVAANDVVSILHEGEQTQWTRVDSADRVWLNPSGANPLQRGVTYDLVRLQDGTLSLQRKETAR